ncbi:MULTISPECIES: hypothetical protein [unclassified Aeromicrobium]|uniref:hypothetical protein n=1 Tax=unclassified Aeromicrobium TaxID=2633570 RepID=UPI00288C6377|nr:MULTISPECIES: hypothetical protein [unclassified Aeromicrobium]
MVYAYIGFQGPCGYWKDHHALDVDTVVYVADRHDLAGLVGVLIVVEAIATREQQDALDFAEQMVAAGLASWWVKP